MWIASSPLTQARQHQGSDIPSSNAHTHYIDHIYCFLFSCNIGGHQSSTTLPITSIPISFEEVSIWPPLTITHTDNHLPQHMYNNIIFVTTSSSHPCHIPSLCFSLIRPCQNLSFGSSASIDTCGPDHSTKHQPTFRPPTSSNSQSSLQWASIHPT